MFISTRNLNVHVRIDGPAAAPPVMLLHSLGTCAEVWGPQAAELARSFRVIRPDMRGHGLTEATSGAYSMDLLADDVAALFEALGLGQAHLGGISIGGMIAQHFAARHPQRVASLMLVDTAMVIPPAALWRDRIAQVQAGGIASIADAVLARWLTPSSTSLPAAKSLRSMLMGTSPEGYAGAAAAIADADLTEATRTLRHPTLVLVGREDMATPVASAQALHQAIAGSSLSIIENAAHIPTIERPEQVTEALRHFLLPPAENAFEAGLATRKRVLGEAHVNRSLARATDFDRDFQHFITEMAWGKIWTRPGLDHRTRSLLTLVITAALGREEEFKLHLRATRQTGATQSEVAEALMHAAIYAGVPAANAAFRMAKEIFAEPPT
jgi:3-oxoadipate enol-lactonase/4-carboxymuconolactone decarboxylase